ncbi:MAG: hypothetical protein AAF485_14350 [Chloroflexota bacterium]
MIWMQGLRRALFLGLLLLSLVACGGRTITFTDPQATQIALEGTITSIQATVLALEAEENESIQSSSLAQGELTATPSPNIVVVTATPEDTVTPLPTSTPTPFSTSTTLPSPTVAAASEGQTIVIVVTPTPAPSPTPKIYATAPILLEPTEGVVVEQGREILLHWSWNGLLAENERFDIKIRPDGQSRSAYVAWEEGTGHTFQANLSPGRYYWSVQVIEGIYTNDSGHPEDRVLQAFLSPESEPRLIIVSEKGPSNPRSVSQAEPAAPSIPYGLAFGGLGFIIFIGWVRKKSAETVIG